MSAETRVVKTIDIPMPQKISIPYSVPVEPIRVPEPTVKDRKTVRQPTVVTRYF